jgi:hypothetical protein
MLITNTTIACRSQPASTGRTGIKFSQVNQLIRSSEKEKKKKKREKKKKINS